MVTGQVLEHKTKVNTLMKEIGVSNQNNSINHTPSIRLKISQAKVSSLISSSEKLCQNNQISKIFTAQQINNMNQ